MYRKALVLSLLCFAACALFWVSHFISLRPSDWQTYRTILQKQQIASSSKQLASNAEQRRQGVRKDIWFTQEDNSRLHYRIESQSSLLTLSPGERKFEIVENLDKIRCWMQDKLYPSSSTDGPMQQIRFLEADQGIYRYATAQFNAQAVALSLFRIPGHSLPSECNAKDAFLKGIAQNVSFAVSGKTPQFQAEHFKAFLRHETTRAQ